MGVMNMAGNAAIATAAVAGTVLLAGKLEKMDSGSIRESGRGVRDFVVENAGKLGDTEIARSMEEKISGTKYGPVFLSAMEKAGKGLDAGFTKLVDGLAAAKEKSEMDGTSFIGNLSDSLTGGLKGAVASAADFIPEGIRERAAQATEALSAKAPSREAEQPQAGADMELG